MDGGGLHFVGDSSTGKSTLLKVAVAVNGAPSYLRSWRATSNGMEGAAAMFNDSLLALDEISECDPKAVGEIVYAVGNGTGKQRSLRNGTARAVTRWRCLVLSNGERGMAATMREAGKHAKAGQIVRLLDIPVERQHGIWDELHEYSDGALLSDALRRDSERYYGTAGRAFLEKLTRDKRDFSAYLDEIKKLPIFGPSGEGQHRRALARMALIGMAGELAIEYGILPWPEGSALGSAAAVFKLWQPEGGTSNSEQKQIIEAVTRFIDRHGASRFSALDKSHSDHERGRDANIRDRAGWYEDKIERRYYLFTSDGMREALAAFDFNRALDSLQAAGILKLPENSENGRRASVVRADNRSVRVYRIFIEGAESEANHDDT
jgi:putative DNA primase/helicase